jgi:hypothetical protein
MQPHRRATPTASSGPARRRKTEPLALQWQDGGLCREVADPELFFPEPAEPAHEALAICAACPVRSDCLDHALRTPEMFGVWGGTTQREREELIRTLRKAEKIAATRVVPAARAAGRGAGVAA